MRTPNEFENIRPYNPDELPAVYEELLKDKNFQVAITAVYPRPFDYIVEKMKKCRTNLEFQKAFIYKYLKGLMAEKSDGFTNDFSAITDKEKNYVFMSNHRDIVMDPALLSVALIDNGMNTVEIAIGDNLLTIPWVKHLVRILKSFIVKRGLTGREHLQAMQLMSRYINFAVNEKGENIWIAQRQGRAKDSDDRTQEGVLKMLSMACKGSPAEKLKGMHIVPTALSYEYDPCDFLKAAEFQRRRDNENFKKEPTEDIISMKTGIFGYKGHVHFQAAPCIDDFLTQLEKQELPKAEFMNKVATHIDHEIFRNYRFFPVNYVALDLMNGDKSHSDHYYPEDLEKFEKYISERIDQIDSIEEKDKDRPYLREKFIEMYANPLKNFLELV